ncbi:DGQHR domain-containing protein [Vibrio maritimus]|jgi:DGQHR domain-containing protein|uniref:DGQHR domain-containing protein n=1 Tax=Vibrio maritimus TaxID=990268 RepID=UPI0040688789
MDMTTIDLSANLTLEQAFELLVITGNEGIGETHLGKITFAQFCMMTRIENDSIDEKARMQRLVQSTRASGITHYAVERENTAFPEVIVVLSNHASVKPIEMPSVQSNGTKLGMLSLPVGTRTFVLDGQGRRVGIEQALKLKGSLAGHHLDVKFWIVPSADVYESATAIRQLFADLHLGLRKPSRSQSIYFDSEDVLNVFANEVLTVTESRGAPLSDAVAVEGRLAQGQWCNMSQIVDFCCAFIGGSKAEVRSALANRDAYDAYLLDITRYLASLYDHLPYKAIQSANKEQWKLHVSNNLFCCAIGLKALGLLGNSLLVDAKVRGEEEFDLAPLKGLEALPFTEKDHALWINAQVYQNIDGKLKIVKSSENRLARLLCTELRVIASAYCNR